MANFMGPMAPPQAAPPQPAQLDIRTNPGQRAQFKSFMQGMQTPPTTAPIAPMLPAPMMSPMDQVDIFAPAPMADGGVVGGLQDLGQMSGQMVEALNTVIYGGGQGMGGGIGSVMQTPPGSLPSALPNIESGVYKQPMNTPMEMPSGFPFANSITTSGFFDVERPGYLESMYDPANDSRQMGDMERYRLAQEDARRQREGGFMGRVVLPGEGSFEDFMNMQPQSDLLQQRQLYEDGGPVGMANGGSPFDYMFDQQREDYSSPIAEQAIEDAYQSALDMAQQSPDIQYEEDPGENAGIDMGNPDPDPDPVVVQNIGTGDEGSASITVRPTVSDTVYTPPTSTGAPVGNVYPYTDNDDFQRQVQEFQRRSLTDPVVTSDRSINPITTPNYGTQRDKNYGMDIFDLLSGDLLSDSVPPTGPGGDEPLFTPAPASPPIIDRNADPDALSPAEELAIARGNPPTPGPYTGSGDSSVLLTGQDGDTTGEIYTPELQLANLANLRITGTGNEKIDGRSVVDDLNKRTAGADAGFSPAGILAKALGGGMATKIEKNVLSGDPDIFPVIDSSTNQIIGYSGKGGRGYTGRPGYNPITAGLFDNTSDRVRYDAATGSYFVDPLPAGYDSPDPQDEEMHRLRAAQAADQTQPPAAPPPPNMITRPDNPVTPAPPPDVVVPSPRDPVNIGGAPVLTSPLLTAPNIDPVQSVGLPQSFLDLLAQLNRPSPRPSPRDLPRDGPVAFQDGGAVLDKAAGDFLEALRVA